MAVTYHYDLELDERDNIVGGEWHSSVHPDFLWLPEKGARALSQGDQWLLSQNDSSEWDLRGPIPPLWKKAAKVSSSVEQPLARILESLLREANR
jgi:hypothetical protein